MSNEHYHLHLIYNSLSTGTDITPDLCNEKLKHIVEKVGMEVMMGPYSDICLKENNDGVTGVIVLETSHSAFHFWPYPDGNGRVSFCIYSCRDYDYIKLIDYLQQEFPVVDDQWSAILIDRTDINEIKVKDFRNVSLSLSSNTPNMLQNHNLGNK